MQAQGDYRVRTAELNDVPQMAELFRQAYEESSHECKETSYVQQSLGNDDLMWSVCEAQGSREIVAVMCVRRMSWNRVYEICYGITQPAHRARGLSRRLYLACIARAGERNDCDLIMSYVRNRAMHEMTTTGYGAPGIAVGHDGALNVANGRREFHLLVVARNRRLHPVRVVPHGGLPRELDGVRRPVLASLAFESALGEYPQRLLVGPQGTEQTTLDGCRITYLRDASSLSGAVHLTHIDQPASPTSEQALLACIDRFSAASWIGVQVLADKTRAIEQLQRAGFRITAYLPGWHCEGGRRYDCIMLVRGRFERAPISHGIEDIVGRFRAAFEGPEHGKDDREHDASVA